MKKLSHLILLSICTLLTLTSCSNDDEEDTHYVNTVFIYMPWTGYDNSSTGSLKSSFQKNLNDIEEAIKEGEGGSQTRTLVLFADDASSSRLFEINNKGEETSTYVTYDQGAFTTTDDLIALFNKVASLSSTETYSIIIGSHGNGWLPAGTNPDMLRSFGGQSKDLQTEVEDLAEAINQSDIKKMQYICFDDCYMANIETAYALRNATKWLIASTSEIMDTGLPYSDIWKYLSSTSVDYSAIIQSFGDFYSNYTSAPYGCLSAIDCSKTEEIASLMKEFNEKYSYYTPLLSRIQALDGYATHVYYDFGSYINEICESDTTENPELYSCLEELVPYKFTTNYLYTAYQGSYTYKVTEFSGIAISDPSQNSAIMSAKKKTEWWQATH